MPTNPPVPSGTTPISIYTFEYWDVIPGVQSDPAVAEANLANLNKALDWSGTNGIPIYSLGKIYQFKPSANYPSIQLPPNCRVICAPGCNVAWVSGVVAPGFIHHPSGSSGASWEGGTVSGVNASGVFPSGDVFNLKGQGIVLRNILVSGYRDGFAFSLDGDRIRLMAPRVENAGAQASGGIRFRQGVGFRCEDGSVEVRGDAILVSPENASGKIEDVAITGTALKTTTGSLIAVESKFGGISNVRCEGIAGKSGDSGSAIRIVNRVRDSGVSPAAIVGLSFREIAIDCGISADQAIFISNTLATPSRAIADLTFVNITIRQPKGVAFWVGSSGTPVEDVRWSGGTITAPPTPIPPATAPSAILSLRRMNDGLFTALSIEDYAAGPAIIVGDGFQADHVVLSDIAITGVAAGQTGVSFDKASSCGWTGGSISGAASDTSGSANATAFALTNNAVACFVENADLSAIGSDIVSSKITATANAGYRLAANYGSVQRTPIGFGAVRTLSLAATATGTAAAITVPSSAVAVTLTGGTTGTLNIVNGGKVGDLLVLSTATTGQTLNVVDTYSAGTVLRLSGNCALANPNDTLTLLRRAADWVEIARSING